MTKDAAGSLKVMCTVRLRPGIFAKNAALTVKVATYSGAIRFLGTFTDYVVAQEEPIKIGESMDVYDWYECWFENATPMATIVREFS
jgi:hypothetical protein